MPSIILKWNSDDLARLADTRPLIRALSRAGGDALRTLRTASSRLIRERKRFKVARVNKAMKLFYPRTKQDLVWRMQVSGAPVPVADFPHRQTKQGVSVQINKGRRTLIRSAFVAAMRSGHEGVFKRVGSKRLPIREAFTTRVTDVFNDADVLPQVYEQVQAKFHSAFARLWKIDATT